jgi:hypothetical protein
VMLPLHFFSLGIRGELSCSPAHTARAGVALHLFWVAVLLAVETLGRGERYVFCNCAIFITHQ